MSMVAESAQVISLLPCYLDNTTNVVLCDFLVSCTTFDHHANDDVVMDIRGVLIGRHEIHPRLEHLTPRTPLKET